MTITITAIVVVIILAVTMFFVMDKNDQNSFVHSFNKMNPFREKTMLEKAEDAMADVKDELEYGFKKTVRHLSD